jgi:hypothetical protein
MVDVRGLGNPASLSAANFEFRVGNSDSPATWETAPAPSSVSVRPGAGKDGADRVTLIWANGVIQKQWLQVVVKADAVTALTTPDVFYFGNAVADSGNTPTNTYVDGSDFAGARDNPRNFLNLAPIDFRYDYNRDSFVDGSDMAAARDNNTNFVTALKLITVPGPAPLAEFGAGGEAEASGSANVGSQPEAGKHNAANPFDANGDGVVTALDALFVINHLHAILDGAQLPYVASAPAAYGDVNNDQVCTALDVLLVVNQLNDPTPGAGDWDLPAAVAGEGPAGEERDGLFGDLETELSPLEAVLGDLATDIAVAWR